MKKRKSSVVNEGYHGAEVAQQTAAASVCPPQGAARHRRPAERPVPRRVVLHTVLRRLTS